MLYYRCQIGKRQPFVGGLTKTRAHYTIAERKREREDQDKPVLFRHNLYCVVRMYDIILTFDPRRCIVLIGQVGPYWLPLYC